MARKAPLTASQIKAYKPNLSEKIVTCTRWVNRWPGKIPIDFIEVFDRCFLPGTKTNIADACFWLYGMLNILILKSTSPTVCKYGFF